MPNFELEATAVYVDRLKTIKGKAETVHSLTVTPEMRASVLSEGQPLFSAMSGPVDPATAKGVRFEVKQPTEGLPTYLRLNTEAMRAVTDVLGSGPINGVNMDARLVPEVATKLKAQAERLTGPAAANLWNLANAVLEYGDRRSGLVVMKAQANPKDEIEVLHEELYHAAVQRRPGEGTASKGVPYEEMAGDPGIEKMRPRIASEIRGKLSELVLVAEASADLAVGTYHELTPEEAEATSDRYYSAVAAAHGTEPLEAAKALFRTSTN